MDSYRGREKIKSIGQLISVMAGNGVSDQRCVYDNIRKIWIEKRFEPLPKGSFEWECLESGTQGETEFVMDSGSQLNIRGGSILTFFLFYSCPSQNKAQMFQKLYG